MNWKLKACLGVATAVVAAQAAAQITFYEGEGFRGRSFTTDRQVGNMERQGFNDRAASVVVERGRWQVCEDWRFQGRCVVLRRGSYESLVGLGLENRISSVRPITREGLAVMDAPEPLPAPTYEYRQRPNERLVEVPVTSVRAVVGPPEQRCWVERQQVVEDRGGTNPGAAIAGAIIGGVLGHQIGNGRGNDVATVGGALAGAAIGNNAGRDGGGRAVYGQDVQRCATAPTGRPAFWDVTYNFRGIEHTVQMQTPPGRTITVNGNGEPRG